VAGTDRTEVVSDRAADVRSRLPPTLRDVIEGAARHQVPVLAGGLAFFGLLSLAPAVGVGLGLLRLLAPDAMISALVDGLRQSFPDTLGLGVLLEQMDERAGRYAGVGLLVMLWPATTLASGWKRALDAVCEHATEPAVRGVLGRLKGVAIGFVLLAGMLVLLGVAVAGTTFLGNRAAVFAMVAVAAVVLQFGFALLVYRVLPPEAPAWSALRPGAAWSTLGVCIVTVALAVALTAAEQFAQQYPPTLSTAVVLGLWLYGANLSLLLGAELNTARQR